MAINLCFEQLFSNEVMQPILNIRTAALHSKPCIILGDMVMCRYPFHLGFLLSNWWKPIAEPSIVCPCGLESHGLLHGWSGYWCKEYQEIGEGNKKGPAQFRFLWTFAILKFEVDWLIHLDECCWKLVFLSFFCFSCSAAKLVMNFECVFFPNADNTIIE